MKQSDILEHIRSSNNLKELVEISNSAVWRFREIHGGAEGRMKRLDVGDSVYFFVRGGKKMAGVIESIGTVNYGVKTKDGASWRVRMELTFLEKSLPRPLPESKKSDSNLPDVAALVLKSSKKLLERYRINLPVVYKRRVWATHFRPNEHIQYGELCLRKQIDDPKTSDSIASNLRRFRMQPAPSVRLAMLVCHETAHAVTHKFYGAGIRAHGAEFYKVLNRLVDRDFSKLCNEFGKIV